MASSYRPVPRTLSSDEQRGGGAHPPPPPPPPPLPPPPRSIGTAPISAPVPPAASDDARSPLRHRHSPIPPGGAQFRRPPGAMGASDADAAAGGTRASASAAAQRNGAASPAITSDSELSSTLNYNSGDGGGGGQRYTQTLAAPSKSFDGGAAAAAPSSLGSSGLGSVSKQHHHGGRRYGRRGSSRGAPKRRPRREQHGGEGDGDSHGLDCFRDSEADFQVLHSNDSIVAAASGDGGGGSSVGYGYLSGTDSLASGSAIGTPICTPPTSSGLPPFSGGLPGIIEFSDRLGGKQAPSAASAAGTATSGPVIRAEIGPPLPSKPADASGGRLMVLGQDLSHLSRRDQFLVCAGGVFGFSLLYGYLQELISVKLCDRRLGLFLASAQFCGYTAWSYVFRLYVNRKGAAGGNGALERKVAAAGGDRERGTAKGKLAAGGTLASLWSSVLGFGGDVPVTVYLGLSLLRALDLGVTNLAMQYVNYPAKTLMKSSRVVFTMLFGVLIGRKKYAAVDYGIVFLMVAGLVVFMHADANSSAVFQPMGIIMLTVSLLCDGAISNMSERVMNEFNVGQDEFIFRLYSIALLAIMGAAWYKGDLADGVRYLSVPGTLDEIERGADPTWSVSAKIGTMVLFSTMGFLGSSCSAAITKNFGALTMSITSTARKATTLFLSFMIFNNVCTPEHVGGIVVFIVALVMKSLRASRRGGGGGKAAPGGGRSGRRRHRHRKVRDSTAPLPPTVERTTSVEMDDGVGPGGGGMRDRGYQAKAARGHGVDHVV